MGSLNNGVPILQTDTTVRNLGHQIELTSKVTDSIDESRFLPSQITGLRLWLDASNESSIKKDINNNVSEWINRAARAYQSLSQSAKEQQPRWLENRQNGLPGINFTRSLSQYLEVDWPVVVDYPATIFVVSRPGNLSSGEFGCPFSVGQSMNTSRIVRYRYSQDTKQLFCRTTVQSGGDNSLLGSYVVGETNLAVSKLQTSRLRTGKFNGSDDGTTVNTTERILTNTGFNRTTVGASIANNDGLTGDVFEILVWDRTISDVEIEQVESYLNDKWGIY